MSDDPEATVNPDPQRIQTDDVLEALLHVADPVERLRRVRVLEAELGELAGSVRAIKCDTVRALRGPAGLGLTWPDIGEILGVSAQRAEALSHSKD